jgi:hypothetical protein
MRYILVILCAFLAACTQQTEPDKVATDQPARIDPRFDAEFWATWGDGEAELNGYDLTFPRYNQLRKGVAVAIFVTEPFSNSLRVKADPGKHAPGDEFPVMKLNLIKDYQTGIYDYNDMLSAFIALAPVNGRPAASATKLSFSSQEWCGHVYSQILFGARSLHWTQHSYFDGEADQQREMDYPENALPEDALFLWARGMAQPWATPGLNQTRSVLTSLETARGKHVPLTWATATLTVDRNPQALRVPAGVYQVNVMRYKRQDGSSRIFYVEAEAPHRIVRWETSEGEKADLLGSGRMKYWEMNKEGGEAALERLGIRRK